MPSAFNGNVENCVLVTGKQSKSLHVDVGLRQGCFVTPPFHILHELVG